MKFILIFLIVSVVALVFIIRRLMVKITSDSRREVVTEYFYKEDGETKSQLAFNYAGSGATPRKVFSDMESFLEGKSWEFWRITERYKDEKGRYIHCATTYTFNDKDND